MSSVVLAQRIQLGPPIATVGRLNDGTLLGRVVDVISDSPGHVVVLDGESNRLVLLTRDGRVIGPDAPRNKSGTKLAYPIKMAFDGPSTFAVLDARSGTILHFAIRDREIDYQSEDARRISGGSSICGSGEALFVMGSPSEEDGTKLVRKLGRGNETIPTFGEQFGERGNVGEGIAYSSGHLLCLPQEHLIVVASRLYPEVRAYSMAGALRWASHLSPFRGIVVSEPTPQEVRYVFPPDSVWDDVATVFTPSAGVVAIQIGRLRGPGGGQRYLSIETRYFAAESGRLLGVQRDVPLIKAVSGDRVFAVVGADHPALQVLPFSFFRK